MHRAAVWQHSSKLKIKIVQNSTEHFLWAPSDFFSDDVLPCLRIFFTNSVFQGPPLKIVSRIGILEIGWPGVIGLMWNEYVPWEVMPEVFKCSVWEMRLPPRVVGYHKRWKSLSFCEIWYNRTPSLFFIRPPYK